MNLVSITTKAQNQMKSLLSSQLGKYDYIRIGTKTKGCAGISYIIEFADAPEIGDEEIKVDETLKILIDNKSILYLAGLEVDFKETLLESGFTFENPNKKGECGCGESFFI